MGASEYLKNRAQQQRDSAQGKSAVSDFLKNKASEQRKRQEEEKKASNQMGAFSDNGGAVVRQFLDSLEAPEAPKAVHTSSFTWNVPTDAQTRHQRAQAVSMGQFQQDQTLLRKYGGSYENYLNDNRRSFDSAAEYEETVARAREYNSQLDLQNAQNRVAQAQKTGETMAAEQQRLQRSAENLQTLLARYQQTGSVVDGQSYLIAVESHNQAVEAYNEQYAAYEKEWETAQKGYETARQRAVKDQGAYLRAAERLEKEQAAAAERALDRGTFNTGNAGGFGKNQPGDLTDRNLKAGIGRTLFDAADAGAGEFNKVIAETVKLIAKAPMAVEDLLTGEHAFTGVALDPVLKWADWVIETADYTKKRADAEAAAYGLPGTITSQLLQGTVAALPNTMLAILSGGGSAVPQIAGQAGGLVETARQAVLQLSKNPLFWTSMAQTLGSSYEEALADGATEGEALVAAVLTAFANSAIEVGGGMETLPGELQDANLTNGQKAWRWLKSGLEEGGEELIQNPLQRLVNKVLTNSDVPLFDLKDQNAVLNPATSAQEFAGGTAIGLILGGGTALADAMLNPYQAPMTQEQAMQELQTAYQRFKMTGSEQDAAAVIRASRALREVTGGAETVQAVGDLTKKEDAAPFETGADVIGETGGVTSETSVNNNIDGVNVNVDRNARERLDVSPAASRNESVDEGIQWAGNMPTVEERTVINEQAEQQEAVGQSGDSQRADVRTADGYGGQTAKRAAARAALRRAEEARRVRVNVQTVGGELTSLQELGMDQGSEQKNLRLVTREAWTPDIEEAWEIADSEGLEFVPVVGKMFAKAPSGKQVGFTAVLQNGRIYAQADSTAQSIREAVLHEIFHEKAARDPALRERIADRIRQTYYREETEKMFQRYYDLYQDAYGGTMNETELAEAIWEEMLADAYAEFQRYSDAFGPAAWSEVVQDEVWSGGETKSETADTGTKFSVETADDGEPIAVINTGQRRFDKSNPKQYAAIARREVLNKFRNQVLPLGDQDLARVTKDTADEYAYPRKQYASDSLEYNAKMRAAPELDNLLQTAEYLNWDEDRTGHKEAEFGFDYYKVKFIVDGHLFEGVANIANSQKGRVLYDITKIKEIPDTTGKYATLLAQSTSGFGDLNDESITGKEQNSNTGIAFDDQNGHALFSIRTWDDGGRETLVRWLDGRVADGNLTDEDAVDMIEQMDEIYNICKNYKNQYAGFSAWSDAKVVVDEEGNPVFSVVKKNGEYPMNLDFSLVCKKRRTLDAVFNRMIEQGMMDQFQMGQGSIVAINDIIRKHGFETACALCFVDAKRFRQADIAGQFVTMYNKLVRGMAPKGAKIDSFNFAGDQTVQPVEGGIETMEDGELNFSHIDNILKKDNPRTVRYKIARLLKESPTDRKLVARGDFMSTAGFDKLNKTNPNVLSLYNAKKGSGGPKAAQSDVQYLSEILKQGKFNRERAYEVGGVRIQSFSDYVPRLVFDYVQMIGDLAAKQLPAHAYTKEELFALQFGKTGVKINLSMVPKVVDGGTAPGLDENGNYAWQEGQSFGSTIRDNDNGQAGFELAKRIQSADGYSENCGTIAVGISDEQIRKMLGDPDIRMVIPYHKSSLNHMVAAMNKIDRFKDYTKVQNTRTADGKKITGQDFNFNQTMKELGDARQAADAYLRWCREKKYIPKFDAFAYHENYYKLLEDFNTYNAAGNFAPQGDVRIEFPTENDPFGSMEQLIGRGLEEDAVLEGNRDSKVQEIVDEIAETLPKLEREWKENNVKFSVEGDGEARDIKEELSDMIKPGLISGPHAVPRVETEVAGHIVRPEGMSDEEYADLDARWQERHQPGQYQEELAPVEDLVIPKTDFTSTPAMDKLGIKIDGSVARYRQTEQLRAYEKAAKEAQRMLKRRMKALRPSETETFLARGLVDGKITLNALDDDNVNVNTVTELADYMMAAESFSEDMIAQRRGEINTANYRIAEDLFKDSDAYHPKLKLAGLTKIVMNERTPERVVKQIFGQEQGSKIYETYFRPVWVNGAEMNRFENRMLDRVAKFEDRTGAKRAMTEQERAMAQRLMEGEAARDNVARLDQDTRERVEAAAKNVNNGEEFVDAVREFNLTEEYHQGLVQAYADYLDTVTVSEDMDQTILKNAIQTYQQIYNEMYDAINDFLVSHGYSEIGFIKGYAPHFQKREAQQGLFGALKALGVEKESVSELPAAIAGRTADFKPNMKWNPHMQSRKGTSTSYDIQQGFEQYLHYAAEMFYHTDDVMRIRQAVNWFRGEYAGETITQAIEDAQVDRYKSVEWKKEFLEKQDLIEPGREYEARAINKLYDEYVSGLFEKANPANLQKYSEFVTWLENYANIVAGKQSLADRGLEYGGGRNALNMGSKLMRRFSAANVAGNLSSVLNQSAQLPLIQQRLGTYLERAIFDMARGGITKDNFVERSDFLTDKRGVDKLTMDNGEKFISALFKPAELMDRMVSTLAVRGRYLQALNEGMTMEQAMKEADDFGRRVMGSRMKGAKPLGFESKTFVNQMLHVFQVEAANTFDYMVLSDMPQAMREIAKTKGKAAAARHVAGYVVGYLINAFLLNRLTDELYGGSPAPFDLMGWALNFAASGFGRTDEDFLKMLIDNAWERLFGERIFETERLREEDGGIEWAGSTAFDDLSYNVLNDVPYVRNAMGLLGLGDQTLPTVGINEFAENVGSAGKTLWDQIWKGEEETGISWAGAARSIGEDLLNAATQILPGGRQIKKSVQGAITVGMGGRYSGDRLQYPVAKNIQNAIQAILFGPSALDAADEYYAEGLASLTAGQTKKVLDLEELGVHRMMTYDLYQQFREINKELTGVEASTAKRNAINNLYLNDQQKLEVYAEFVMDKASENYQKNRDQFQAMLDAGLTWDDVTQTHNVYAMLNEDEEMNGTAKATEFAKWVDQQDWNKTQRDAVEEKFKFWMQMPAQAANYEKFEAAGVAPKQAADLANVLAGLKPEDGKETVSLNQKVLAIDGSKMSDEEKVSAIAALVPDKRERLVEAGVSDRNARDMAAELALAEAENGEEELNYLEKAKVIASQSTSDRETLAAVSTVLNDSTYRKVELASGFGVPVEYWISYRDEWETTYGDDSVSQEKVENVLDGMMLTNDERAVLWQIANKSWKPKNNPYNRGIGEEVYWLLNEE